jgi:hypothetical protein
LKLILLLIAASALTSCDYKEVTRETGYKGKARVNPWLAAERFCKSSKGKVRSLASWTEPTMEDVVWFVPASVLGNESFTRRLESWVYDGGHLVVLVDHADATDDWSSFSKDPTPSPALLKMLVRAGISLEPPSARDRVKSNEIEFMGQTFQVEAELTSRVTTGEEDPGVFASVEVGDGRLTVLTDSRLFRNRWIDKEEHIDLLDALVSSTGYEGNIGFTRGAALSLWSLLSNHLWPLLVGLAVLILLWLWKNLSRFGPLEAAHESSPLRGYDHHLEALGDFQWRLDKAKGLLDPMKAKIVEDGQRATMRTGNLDADFFQFLADRSGLPRERVFRALAESAPPDSAVLTRTTADLQRLLKALH